MAEVVRNGVFSPEICGYRSVTCRSRRGVCDFPANGSVEFSLASSRVQSLRLCVRAPSSSSSDFCGRRVAIGATLDLGNNRIKMSTGIIGKAQRWWEKGLQTNMKEVSTAQDLVESLTNAGDKLVVVDFFSPGCGGCKALHPKMCQLAEMNPNVQFLQVNYEVHKSMCYSLNVHVLPFFRFYRGAEGRVCSFSCTNATIKKFKDALAKYSPERCSLGPAKGLEEKELLALAANRDLSFTYIPKPEEPLPLPLTMAAEKSSPLSMIKQLSSTEERTFVSSGR